MIYQPREGWRLNDRAAHIRNESPHRLGSVVQDRHLRILENCFKVRFILLRDVNQAWSVVDSHLQLKLG